MKHGRWMAGALVCTAVTLMPLVLCTNTLLAEPYSGQRGSIGGRPAPGYLGIDLKDVSDERVSSLKLKDAHGAEITRVDHDGPAGRMGLRVHDVVMLLNGVAIDGVDQARRLLHELSPGKLISMVINRDGQQVAVQAQMADRGELEKESWERHLAPPPEAPATGLPAGEPAAGTAQANGNGATQGTKYSRGFMGTLLMTPTYTGVILEKLGPQLAGFFGATNGNGLLVRSVAENSPAAMAGLHAGDVVVRANQASVASPSDWTKAIREAKGGPVNVVVLRDRQEKTFTLTPDTKKRSCIEMVQPVKLTVMARLTEL